MGKDNFVYFPGDTIRFPQIVIRSSRGSDPGNAFHIQKYLEAYDQIL